MEQEVVRVTKKRTAGIIFGAAVLGIIVIVLLHHNSGELEDTGEHMKVVTGTVIGVLEDKKVLIEVTEERGGYRKGERLIVRFTSAIKEVMYQNSAHKQQNAEVQLKDVMTVQFSEVDGQENGYDYVETDEVTLYEDYEAIMRYYQQL